MTLVLSNDAYILTNYLCSSTVHNPSDLAEWLGQKKKKKIIQCSWFFKCHLMFSMSIFSTFSRHPDDAKGLEFSFCFFPKSILV